MTTDSQERSTSATIDPILADIIIHKVASISDLIDKNISQSAFSTLISEYKDFAVGILDAEGRLISQCRGGLPIFVANALSAAVKEGLELFGPDGLGSGDVVINNRAATMGQHLNNVVMYTPIRTGEDGQKLVGFMAVVAHWMDVGGAVVGSCFDIFASDVYAEGIQFPSIRILVGGERVSEVYRLIQTNTRFPKLVTGDIEAQVAGCILGRDMMLAIVDRYGIAAINAAVDRSWSRSEANARRAIEAIPDGEYKATSFLDDDGRNLGVPLPIEVTVRVKGSSLEVDLSGVAKQVSTAMNAGFEGGAVAAARIACNYVFGTAGAVNDGTFRPIEVTCPTGTLLSATADAPIGHSGMAIPTVVDTILRAFANAGLAHIPAAHHGTYCIHLLYGRRADGAYFQHMESCIGGWGAAAGRDGSGPYRSVAHGDTLEVPIELQEALNPYRVKSVRLRIDSGGPGRWRGGVGVEKEYEALIDANVMVNIERTKCAPWGLLGARPGKTGGSGLVRNGEIGEAFLKNGGTWEKGAVFRVFSGGGGGYGNPLDRPTEEVLQDVQSGYVSEAAALADYGVTISLTESGAVARRQ